MFACQDQVVARIDSELQHRLWSASFGANTRTDGKKDVPFANKIKKAKQKKAPASPTGPFQ